jgi:glycosyltransferase involved in cell wall biosynthesis
MGKVAILAVLANLEPRYSVAGVTWASIRLLSRMGHEVVLVTTSDYASFRKFPPGVEVRTYDRFNGDLDEGFDRSAFDAYVRTTSQRLASALEDCPVCLTQDVVFLRSWVAVNCAMRQAAESLPAMRWLHWIHSAPSDRPEELAYPFSACFADMPRSLFICVNHTDAPALAAMYDVPVDRVRTVHNYVDPETFLCLHPLAAEFYTRYRLYEADTVCVYPTRLVKAKQIDKVVKLMSHLKRLGRSVRLFVCDSYANAEREQALARDLQEQARSLGLSEDECVVTSLVQSRWAAQVGHKIEFGVPNQVVGELMQLADLFVLPSLSEACSMIMLEAGLTKNLTVLNRDLETTSEFLGPESEPEATDRGLTFSFGSAKRAIGGYLPDEETWYADRARMVIEAQEHDRAISFFKYVRKYHSPAWVYENQLQPLLEG